VALHRGSRVAEGVKFQGRDTAYVNLGTQAKAILDHIRQNAPLIAAEIDSAQAAL
jgi:endonuclease G